MTPAHGLMPQRLGTTSPTIPRFVFGCMGMSGMHGPADERESIATIHAALNNER